MDDHITNVIIKNKDWYERRMLDDIYARTRGADGLALDVGACFGTHTTWFAAVCGLQTIAFEPADDSFEFLQNNVNRNDLQQKVTLVKKAVGKQPGFVIATRPNVGNRGASPVIVADAGIPMVSIDSLQPYKVSLIKIDVEGMEMDVLAGAEETIRKYHPLIYVEAVETYPLLWRFMDKLGYHRLGKWNATPTYGWSV